MSEQDEEIFINAEICSMCCQTNLTESQYISPNIKGKMEQNNVKSVTNSVKSEKASDHCHITVKYQRAAHVFWNINNR